MNKILKLVYVDKKIVKLMFFYLLNVINVRNYIVKNTANLGNIRAFLKTLCKSLNYNFLLK